MRMAFGPKNVRVDQSEAGIQARALSPIRLILRRELISVALSFLFPFRPNSCTRLWRRVEKIVNNSQFAGIGH
jgi:hypothetical protein